MSAKSEFLASVVGWRLAYLFLWGWLLMNIMYAMLHMFD